jgi:hypothetical protein
VRGIRSEKVGMVGVRNADILGEKSRNGRVEREKNRVESVWFRRKWIVGALIVSIRMLTEK